MARDPKQADPDQLLARFRAICLAFPDTRETLTWGEPHFRVGDKIFGGYGIEDGRPTIGMKLEKDHAAAIIADPRFRPAKYVGKHGWVSMDADAIDDWEHVTELVTESYRLIAPKRSLAKLAAMGSGVPSRTTAAPKRRPSKKPTVRKVKTTKTRAR